MSKPTPKPVHTTLPIRGLTTPVTILHITDVHACALTEAEAAAMPACRRDYALERRAFFSEGRPYPPEAVLPALMDYAREIEADLTLLTGDIADFPSEANLSLLEKEFSDSPIPTLFITGNHDWSFADDYHTGNAAAAYLPRMDALSGGNHRIAVVEFDRVVVCALDNGLDRLAPETVEAYMDTVRAARTAGKALVLAMHIPLKADTLAEDTVRVWHRDLCLGRGATGDWDVHTVNFCREVGEATAFAPDAVIAGHLHFDHEDRLPNGVPQLVTGIGCGGHCRVIRCVPQ